MVDPSILAVLRQAVVDSPADAPLRRHFIEVLFRAEAWTEVLTESEALLALSPGDQEALGYAAAAAEALARDGGARPTTSGGSGPPLESPTAHARERVLMADVAGMEDVKRRIELAVLNPLRHPDITRAYRQAGGGGLLLYGPPGCGKTFLARAVAGELGSRFITANIADIFDMYFGRSERNLAAIFREARARRPAVVFFDEIDALGRKRTMRRDDAGRDVANVLLAELDGVDASNEGLFVIGATNHPWDVDVALRRPGRLDRTLFVPPPDEQARRALFELGLREPPTDGIDVDWLAVRTNGYSGADIIHVCRAAVEVTLGVAITSQQVRPVTMTQMREALGSVKPSVRAWFETARNYALFANAAGDWDDLAAYMKAERLL